MYCVECSAPPVPARSYPYQDSQGRLETVSRLNEVASDLKRKRPFDLESLATVQAAYSVWRWSTEVRSSYPQLSQVRHSLDLVHWMREVVLSVVSMSQCHYH